MSIMNSGPSGKRDLVAQRGEEHPFAVLQREMNHIFDSFARSWGRIGFPEIAGSFSPRLDLSENEKALVIAVELPGMSDKDIDLSLAGDRLTIQGEKKDEREEKGRNYYHSERTYGSFSRSISLPRQIDTEKVSASFAKGVLTITLPKTPAEREEGKKISVRTE